jgi:hypothetical protein
MGLWTHFSRDPNFCRLRSVVGPTSSSARDPLVALSPVWFRLVRVRCLDLRHGYIYLETSNQTSLNISMPVSSRSVPRIRYISIFAKRMLDNLYANRTIR